MSDNAWYFGLRIPFKHPQLKTCDCGITSQEFCFSWKDKPFSRCLKKVSSEEKETSDKE